MVSGAEIGSYKREDGAPWGGILEGMPEIIPDEPDTDNAGVGRKDNKQEYRPSLARPPAKVFLLSERVLIHDQTKRKG